MNGIIRVIRGDEVTGRLDQDARWHYSVAGWSVSGLSRQPLSDACRQLIAQGVDPDTAVGRFREGRDQPDLTSTVGAAAGLTVKEPDKGSIRFARFTAFDRRLVEAPAPASRTVVAGTTREAA
jgi:hypothetical protein